MQLVTALMFGSGSETNSYRPILASVAGFGCTAKDYSSSAGQGKTARVRPC